MAQTEAQRTYYLSHREERLEYARQYYAAERGDSLRKEERAESNRKYYLQNKEHKLAYLVQWRTANPNKKKGYDQKYYQRHKIEISKRTNAAAKLAGYVSQKRWTANHKEQVAELNRRWALNNRIKRCQSARQWRNNHLEEVRAAVKRWRKANLDKARMIGRDASLRRRVQKMATPITALAYESIMLRDKMVCGICNKKVARKDMSFDHRIPLSKGGPHVEWNIQVAHLKCNIMKSTTVIPVQMRMGF